MGVSNFLRRISNDCPETLLIDIGNSTIHFRSLSIKQSGTDFSLPIQNDAEGMQNRSEWSGRLTSFFSESMLSGSVPVVICSVNRPALKQVVHEIQSLGFQQLEVLSYDRLEMSIGLKNPEKVGIDRLVAAYLGKHFLEGQSSPAVIVDAGSAVTVDLLDADGAFCGGMIYPGPGLASWSLSSKTDALPFLQIPDVQGQLPDSVGRDTKEAIEKGLFFSQLSGIKGCVGAICESKLIRGTNAPVVLASGGGLEPFKDFLPEDWILRSNLVLDGLAVWVGKNRSLFS